MNVKTFFSLIPFAVAVVVGGCGSEEPPKVMTTATDTCHVDFINGDGNRLVQISAGQVDIRGWAFDKNTQTTPANLDVILKDAQGKSTVLTGAKRGERPDVAKLFKNDAYLQSGFWLKTDVSALASGVYGITLKMAEGDRVIVCGVKKNITVQ